MTAAPDLSPASELVSVLRQSLGPDAVTDAPDAARLMSQDIWDHGETAAFVVRPGSVSALQEAVAAAHARGVSLNPRGGGMSYTSGYTPDRPGVGVLDLTGLDQIVEINAQDMYVTVQSGCTWKTLHEALAEHGLRTPFWGPLSGLSSTIGGGLSQNNAFFGAGSYGPTADSVTSVAVVLADGSLVRTGPGGLKNGAPFWRHYGPDLTGLFLGDCGAFGHKAEASFRLIPLPEHEDWASFSFTSRDACAQAMAEVARQNIACEVFGFDPNLQALRLRRASLVQDAKSLAKVISGQGSVIKGLAEGAKVAMAGRSFVEADTYSLHLVVEGRSQSGVREDITRLKSICESQGGQEIENSIPKIIRSAPFQPLNNMLGPDGERWAPVHGIVPLSQGAAAWAEIDAAFAAMNDDLAAHDITTGYLITSLSTTGFLLEPVFLWPEALMEIHEASVEPAYLKRLPRHDPNPEATAVVARARQACIDVFERRGAAHFQIGRTYPYRRNLVEPTRDLLDRIKAVIDPHNRVNPGVLGLAAQ